jgi:hypothetical protein
MSLFPGQSALDTMTYGGNENIMAVLAILQCQVQQ